MKASAILYLLLFSMQIFAQGNNTIKPSEISSDSSNEVSFSNNFYKLDFNFPTLYQKYLMHDFNFSEPQLSYSVWFLSKPGLFESANYPPLMQKGDMLRTYNMLYKKDKGMQTLQMMLGAAQGAAVGIMAYKHIKKYGFK